MRPLPLTFRRLLAVGALCLAPCSTLPAAAAELPEVIEKIKPSIVMVGTFNRLGSPQFITRGTGFVIGDGNQAATNFHVVNTPPPFPAGAVLALRVRTAGGEQQARSARIESIDKDHDLAILRFDGPALPKLTLNRSDSVREGQSIALTGFPIGDLVGFTPVTHRGIVSAITPVALPSMGSQQLNANVIHRIRDGVFDIFQLDATAYPGNSGSPVYDACTGEVIAIINKGFVAGTKEAAITNPSGISYAVPSNYLINLLNGGRKADSP